MPTAPIIEFKQVSFAYQQLKVLDKVDLQIEAGEFLGLVGPNGGGKSTLLKLMLGLLQPQNGQINILGGKPVEQAKHLGYVPQFASFPRDYPIAVAEVVLSGRLGTHKHWWSRYKAEDKAIAEEVMQQTEISDLAGRSIDQLSGGQLQRVLIARALVTQPQVLILDEPTANIDHRAEADIFDLLKTLQQQRTIIVVSHDIGFISQYISRVACLNQTLLCHDPKSLTGGDIQDLYHHDVQAIPHQH